MLEHAGIPYMVTGSIAMNYYAVPRMTRDIDIIIELQIDEIQKLKRFFEEEYYIDEDVIKEAIQNQTMFNIIHNASVIKLDFIIRKQHEYRKEEFQRRKKVKIGEFEIFIVCIEDLILSKLFWAKDSLSEMQLNDVRNLLQSDYDLKYLHKWAQNLGLKALLDTCLPNS